MDWSWKTNQRRWQSWRYCYKTKTFWSFCWSIPGVEALLSHNEVVDYQNESKSILQVGDKISTYIIKFNPADKRIALSVHEASAEPAQESTEE